MVTPQLLGLVLNKSLRTGVVFISQGGRCELWSHGKMLRRFDKYEKLELAPDGKGVKVVERLIDMPFETKKNVFQSTPMAESYVHRLDRIE